MHVYSTIINTVYSIRFNKTISRNYIMAKNINKSLLLILLVTYYHKELNLKTHYIAFTDSFICELRNDALLQAKYTCHKIQNDKIWCSYSKQTKPIYIK